MRSRPPRRALGRAPALLLAPLVIAISACGVAGSAPPSQPAGGSAGPGTSAGQSTSPAASEPGPGPSTPAQADTAWGRIWEGLPAAFPQVAGSEPTEVGNPEPASATLDVPAGGGIDSVVSFYRSALEAAGYSVSVDGPLENGSFTISATGSAGCAAQVSVEPLGSSITVTVLYGAACPFD
jgi:hypothetical protein